MGNSGSGTFNQSGGTNTVSNNLSLGASSGSSGTYSLSGGSLSGCWEYIGPSGSGTFTQSGGSHTVWDLMVLGSGTYNLSNTGSLTASYWEDVSNNGAFIQSGGTNAANCFSLGWYTGGTGTYSLNGGSLVVANSAFIGDFGNGSFTQSGGSVSVTGGDLSLGYSMVQYYYDNYGNYTGYSLLQGNGTYNLNAPVVYDEGGNPLPNLSVSGNAIIGNGGTGTFIHQSGVHQIARGPHPRPERGPEFYRSQTGSISRLRPSAAAVLQSQRRQSPGRRQYHSGPKRQRDFYPGQLRRRLLPHRGRQPDAGGPGRQLRHL